MGSKEAVEKIVEDASARRVLRKVRNLTSDIVSDLSRVRDHATRMIDEEKGSEVELDFWNLVEIRAVGIIEKVEVLEKQLKGESDD